MPESHGPLLEAGAEAHERFVRECREIDVAYAQGRLDEWIQEKLDREQFEPETQETTE